MKELFEMLKNGGMIVSSAACNKIEIAIARDCNRFYVDDNGFGFVYLPTMDKALEMQKEVAVKFLEWMDDGRCAMNFNDEDGNPTIVDTEGFYDYFITNIYLK